MGLLPVEGSFLLFASRLCPSGCHIDARLFGLQILDFLDTVFIVARGKWRQLSFLHVYHHFSIFFFYWVNVNAGYDGDIFYTIIANSFVHLVMYWWVEKTCELATTQ